MPMTVIQPTVGLNFGFPGTRAEDPGDLVSPMTVNSTSAPITFGSPVLVNSDFSVTLAGATLTNATFAGIAVREIKTNTASFFTTTAGTYVPGEVAAILRKGKVSVTCNVGTPAANVGVYVRVALNSSVTPGVIGGFEAAADGANTVQLTNVAWATPKDANGTATLEIMYPVTV